jgi:hypothetical protein
MIEIAPHSVSFVIEDTGCFIFSAPALMSGNILKSGHIAKGRKEAKKTKMAKMAKSLAFLPFLPFLSFLLPLGASSKEAHFEYVS